MRIAENLFPDNMPQCEAKRTNIYANDTPDTDKRCTKSARFKVGGKCYCLRHAEIAALSILLIKDLEEKVND